jgi:transcriptional regulator with GAF, ATPase, and Fis domain
MSNDTTSSGSNHIGAVQGTDPSQFSVGPPHVETSESAQSDKKPDADRDLESQLVDQTKTQIRTLVQEIAALSKSDCSQEDFFEGFLTRATSALASLGGAIWVRKTNEDPLKLNYHINLKQTNLATDKTAQRQHSLLINKLVEQGEPTIISPNSGGGDPAEAGNPTDRLLVFAPLRINNETVGLVEIFQRPNAGPSTQRGYLRFVSQMADLASDYLSNQRIKSFADQQSMWQQLEQFIRSVHQGLDTQQTIYTIANEGRRLTEADRVSVAIGKGRGCRVKAVSGLDSIERRAEQVKKLGELAATVIRTGQPLWYDGDDDDLPPKCWRSFRLRKAMPSTLKKKKAKNHKRNRRFLEH